MKEIVLLDPIYGPTQTVLEERFKVHRAWDSGGQRADVLRRFAGRVECVVSHSRFGMSPAEMDALPALKLIANFGVGLDRLNIGEAHRRGIVVTHTPDELTQCVADMAWALMLALMRGILTNDRFVRGGEWTRGPAPLSQKVCGESLGILGMGRIGQTIARRAAGFDMRVGYMDPFARLEGVRRFETARDLAAWSKVLVVACPGTPATRHIVDAGVLDALGREGYLVNVSRGSNVDERALAQALADGRIGGAALDVFENEPAVPLSLLESAKVIVQPHASSATHQTYAAMGQTVLDNLEAFHADGRLRSMARPQEAAC